MKLSDIRGHSRAVARLERAVVRDRLPNTYLFAGPDGIGKFATARALAARLLCAGCGKDVHDACGRCSSCLWVERESHPDLCVVRLMGSATEIKIDQVRELQRRLRLWPIHSRRKVAIIDDAHRLNTAAQNAMLKTFEEPPVSVLLILVASNVASLLPTVLSRCQRIDFFPLPADVVEAILVERCGVAVNEAGDIASYGDGSVADALLCRADLIERARTQLLPLLTTIETRPYEDLAALAQDWGRVQTADLLLLLRTPLAWYRQRLLDAAADLRPGRDVRTALSQLRTVYATMEDLRRHANRQLALDAMLLDLQDMARSLAGPEVANR